jgi:hypothetical protein
MATCFIIQPFDNGKFDKRYADVYKPAILAAGLEPYRVDQDVKVEIPINDIEKGIKSADVCFAEISLDNPNVWFELGFAISAQRDVLMVCSKERSSFPFDVRHRNILRYDTESSSDFDFLKSQITVRLKAMLEKAKHLPQISEQILKDIAGLEQHEMVALATIAESISGPSERVPMHIIRTDMERALFTKLATIMALKSLTDNGFVEATEEADQYGDSSYFTYSLTRKGWIWLQTNRDQFVFRHQKKEAAQAEDSGVPF